MNLPGLTGLRGWAALAVVLYHAAFEFGPHHGGDVFPGIRFLWFGVDVFFILSGFLLTATYRDQPYTRYLVSRFLRIAPAYYASIPFTILLMQVVVPPAFFEISLFAHFTFSQNITPHTLASFNVLYWTLAVEWQLYILIPLVVLAMKRPKTAIIGALLVTLASRFWGFEWMPWWSMFLLPAYLFHFALGAGLATWSSWQTWTPRTARIVFYGSLAASFVWLTLTQPSGFFEQANHGQIPHTYIRPVLAALLVGTVAGAANLPEAHSKASQFLGTISYSLYLTHVPIMLLFRRIDLFQYGLVPYTAIAVTASILVGWVFYCAIEAPSLRFRSWLLARKRGNFRASAMEVK